MLREGSGRKNGRKIAEFKFVANTIENIPSQEVQGIQL
jgi:hypothetical protein